jgi:hypothetical protein
VRLVLFTVLIFFVLFVFVRWCCGWMMGHGRTCHRKCIAIAMGEEEGKSALYAPIIEKKEEKRKEKALTHTHTLPPALASDPSSS